VDHDHETGLIRGLLCHRCNFVVAPIFEKNRDRIIGYYTSPPAVATIGEHHGYTGPVHDNMNMRMHHLGPEVLNAREEYERTKPTAVQILDTFMSPVE